MKQRRYWWTKEELDYLQSLVGDYPTSLAIEYFQQWASSRGYPSRSRASIRYKLQADFGSSIPIGIYITTATIRELVGVTYTTIDRWVELGFLKPHFHPSPLSTGERTPRRHFLRSDLVKLARKMPHLFAGASRQNLFLLLENEDLADQIHERFPYRRGRDPKPVVCVETGKKYRSMTEAGNAVFCHRSNIHNAVVKGHKASGLHWRWA